MTPPKFIRAALALGVCLVLACPALAETPAAPPKKADAQLDVPEGGAPPEFESSETFLDVTEAVRSRQYVHRTILSTVINATSRFSLNRFYVNHLLGFGAVLQIAAPGIKYSVPSHTIAAGWVSEKGHGLELGTELSHITTLYGGYRYFYKPEGFSLWPLFGFGAGGQISQVRFSSGPPQSLAYNGPKAFGYVNLALLIPLVDVGMRAEIKVSFYGLSRVVFTQGIGAIIFL